MHLKTLQAWINFYPDELEIGSADYENATFKPKKLEAKGLEEFIEKKKTMKTVIYYYIFYQM